MWGGTELGVIDCGVGIRGVLETLWGLLFEREIVWLGSKIGSGDGVVWSDGFWVMVMRRIWT